MTSTAVPVQAGLFTARLDFGTAAFVGQQRWLEIAVKTPAAGAYTVLSRRQELTAAPNALWAERAGQATAVTGGSLVAPATAGNVGIGTADPIDLLHVAADIRVGAGTTGCVKDAEGTIIAGTCASDARFKTNIEPFPPMLDRAAQLQPVEFDWRAGDFPEKGFGERRSFGLIAQDVEKLFPELVVTDAQGNKAVNYSRLPLVLLQALKEDNARLEAERARRDRLEEERARNDRLEDRLAELERRLAAAGR